MGNSRHRQTRAALGTAVALALAACGDDDDAGTAPEEPRGGAETASASDETLYATSFFGTPLDIVLPSWLEGSDVDDSANFLTWNVDVDERALRFMRPVAVYPPGSGTTAAVPDDFVAYVDGFAAHGAVLTDRSDTTVGGQPATVLTISTEDPFEGSLDGVLGCPEEGLPAASCFGPGDEVILRLAIVDTGDGPLLIWLRNPAGAGVDMVAEAEVFADLLAGVRFADRRPEVAQAAEATPLDGTYQWTLTTADALATPGQNPDDSYPWTFTVTLDRGDVSVHVEYVGGSEDHQGTYEATDDHIEFNYAGLRSSYDVVQDTDGTLHLTAIEPVDPGDAYVNTAQPWTKVG
jgi:hypothetical protein